MAVTIVQLFLSVIFAVIAFLLVPVILCLRGGLYSNKKIWLITILNHIGASVVCILISLLLNMMFTANLILCLVLSFIGHRLLKKHCGF